jgi:excisionase family DNA binding protein
MESIQITQLSKTELENIIRNSVNAAVSEAIGNSPQNNDMLSFKEAAKFLNLAAPTLYKKTSKGEIPFLKSGKKILFNKARLIEWLNNSK